MGPQKGYNPTFLIGIGKLRRTPQENHEVSNPTFLIGIWESHGPPEECPIQTPLLELWGTMGTQERYNPTFLIGKLL